jgi:hypothetical protein
MANKKKILKNNTVSDIDIIDISTTLPLSGQITIEPGSYYLLAESIDIDGNLATKIRSGDIIVNDGENDLTVANGFNLERAIDYLKHPDTAFNVRFLSDNERTNGFASKNVQEAIEESRNSVIGKHQDFEFTSTGVTFNKWLNVGHPSVSSDEVPYTVAWDGEAIGMTYSNKNPDTDIDIEFYIDEVLTYTWEIRNKKHAYKVLESGIFSLDQGEMLSAFAKKVTTGTGTNPADVYGEVIARSTSFNDGEGGA